MLITGIFTHFSYIPHNFDQLSGSGFHIGWLFFNSLYFQAFMPYNDSISILKTWVFCRKLYKQEKNKLPVLTTNISVQVSSWLAAHAKTVVFSLSIANITKYQNVWKSVANMETFLEFTDQEEIYKPSTKTKLKINYTFWRIIYH